MNATYYGEPATAIYRHRWTMLPALPASRESVAYAALRRVWADHTMNTLEAQDDAQVRSRGVRGAYRTGCEDHISMVLFENWAAFEDMTWVAELVRSCGGTVEGRVTEVGWSYLFEQVVTKGKRPRIVDIVLRWLDAAGEALLIIEAKRPGNRTIGNKDIPSRSTYGDLPSFRTIPRRHLRLLVGAEDETTIRRTAGDEPIVTWSRLASLQIAAAQRLSVGDALRGFVVGSLIHQYALCGILPDALPYPWLSGEPEGTDISVRAPQPIAERERPYWRRPRFCVAAPG